MAPILAIPIFTQKTSLSAIATYEAAQACTLSQTPTRLPTVLPVNILEILQSTYFWMLVLCVYGISLLLLRLTDRFFKRKESRDWDNEMISMGRRLVLEEIWALEGGVSETALTSLSARYGVLGRGATKGKGGFGEPDEKTVLVDV